MAENQNKFDAAAEKAFADAAAKNADAASKAKPVAVEASTNAKPAEPAKADPAPQAAPAEKRAAERPVAIEKKAEKPDPVRSAPARKAAAKKKVSPKVKIAKVAPVAAPATAPIEDQISKPTTTISQLKDKIMATANTSDFSEKMKTGAADVQARMRTAYEKGTEMTKDVTEFHKSNFEAMIESGKVFAAGMQDISRNAIESAKADAEIVTEDVRKMAAVKNPTELFQLQGEIARRNLDMLVGRTSKTAEAWMKLTSDAIAPLSSRASVAMDRMQTAA